MTQTKLIVNLTRDSTVCVGEMADRPLRRMRGLMGRAGLGAGEGVLIRPAPAIHTAFMRFPIDALFLDDEMRVLQVVEDLAPWRIASQRRANSVLELAAGESDRLGLEVGDVLGLRDRVADDGERPDKRGLDSSASPLALMTQANGDGDEDPSTGATGILIASPDRRFRAVTSVLLTRRRCAVTSRESVAGIDELIAAGGADVVVLDSDELPDANIEELPEAVGVVLVSDQPRSSGQADPPTVAKWGPLDDLVAAIESADPRHGERELQIDPPQPAAEPPDPEPPLRHRVVVSLLAALVVLAAFVLLPLDRAVVAATVGAVLVVLSAIDIQRHIIPNRIVLPAVVIVLLEQLILFPDQALEWLLGAVLAACIFMLPQLIGRAWMGMGDVKLAMLLGAALGWGVVGATLLAFVCVLPVALVLLVREGAGVRKSMIPFGPFLAIGALIVLLGPPIVGLPSS